ncbi:MAG TPA: MoaD/ThiS family protein, partial [Candidatus Binataceae bacterium]|nr:MoaD/ThiS family protein [Candidatus Binataceae bacterium]
MTAKRLTLKLFATLRERAGAGELVREFPDGATIAEIWAALVREFPALRGHHDSVGFAVNHEYVAGDYRPRTGDEIAFIPPVSGGVDFPAWVGPVTIGRTPIDVAGLDRVVADSAAGAIVSFTGMTRRDNAGRRVVRLEYEAYEPMALSEMRKLAREAGTR